MGLRKCSIQMQIPCEPSLICANRHVSVEPHVNRDIIRSDARAWAKPALAAVLALLMIWLVVFGTASTMHAATHADGGGHDCAICLFAKGHLLTADVPIASGALLLFVAIEASAAPRLLLTSVDLRLGPSRGPPLRS